MGFKCGIVGLPNVGKSTLFNALTRAGIDAENFPFCTIEPNAGVVPVPDPRQARIAAIVKPQREVPTTMEFVDIAGLVAGASRGEGLGNQFLANIRETDAIAHVVRCFDNDNVIHVANAVDPAADIEVINTELALADLESCEKQLQKVTRTAKSGDKEAVALKALLENRLLPQLNEAKPVRALDFDPAERALLRTLFLLFSLLRRLSSLRVWYRMAAGSWSTTSMSTESPISSCEGHPPTPPHRRVSKTLWKRTRNARTSSRVSFPSSGAAKSPSKRSSQSSNDLSSRTPGASMGFTSATP